MHIDTAAIQRMTAALFIERAWRSRSSTKFWVLLILAAIIASAGVVADSTATVIGAMIVAPLMTPILGSALALILADKAHLLRSVMLVVAGAAVVILIGYLVAAIGNGAVPHGPANSSIDTPAEIINYWQGQSTFVDGLSQETCRDFTHTGYGISAISHVAETARIQGQDLYLEFKDRLRHALGSIQNMSWVPRCPPGCAAAPSAKGLAR